MLDFIEQSFISFLNMSITGSYIILAIMLVRLILKKAPKIFSYCLWAIAGLRLLFKFSFSSVISIFNIFSVPSETSNSGASVNNFVPEDIGLLPVPKISSGIPAADAVINPILPEATVTESINPMQIITIVASLIWIAGIVAMIIYGIISLIKVHKNIEFATKLRDNVFECEKIKSPFVFGILKPKIYLPCKMDDKQKEYVILHEKTHIKRFDHIIKIISFAVLTLHWYNPLVWIAYSLMIRDMEMSCDEKVLKNMSEEDKKNYGFTLVMVGSSRKFAASAPLSFGENVVEERIVNILKFKKSKIAVIILCIFACVAVAAVCLTNANAKNDEYDELEKKIETHIEKNIPDKVAAAEIITVTTDNKAYCWIQNAHFDFSYSSYLNGTTEKKIESFTHRVNNAVESGYFLTEDGFIAPVKAEVHFDKNMNVVHIEGLPDETPVDMGDEAEYTEIIWQEIAENAEEKLNNAYGGKYNIKNAEIIGPDSLNKLNTVGFEIVEYLGSPVVLMETSSNLTVANTVQIPYYRIDSDFNVRVLSKGSETEGEILKRKDGKYHENSMYLIEGGSGKEYLCIYELAPYLDNLEKDNDYFIDINIETPFGEKTNASIKFSVKSNKTYNKKSTLDYDNISDGFYNEITEKIIAPISGWIAQGYSNTTNYALSEEDIEAIANAYNQTTFNQKYEPDREILYDEVFCVQIKADSGMHSIIVVSADTVVTADYSKRLYGTNNEVLCRTIAEIFYKKQAEAIESTTAAPDLPDDFIPQTKPPRNPDSSAKQPELYTGVTQYIPVSAPVDIKPYYAVSDIMPYLAEYKIDVELLGIVYETSYSGGPYLLLTMVNNSDNEYYIKTYNDTAQTNGFILEKKADNQWIEYKQTVDNIDNSTAVMYKNTFCTVFLDIPELENGFYRVTLPIYENNSTADELVVEFALTKYVKQASAGSYITKPVSFVVDTGASGMKYTVTQISSEDKAKIVETYNNFKLNPTSKPEYSTNYYYVEITDNKGLLHAFFIFSDGTVCQNNTYFKPANGKEMYNLIRQCITI